MLFPWGHPGARPALSIPLAIGSSSLSVFTCRAVSFSRQNLDFKYFFCVTSTSSSTPHDGSGAGAISARLERGEEWLRSTKTCPPPAVVRALVLFLRCFGRVLLSADGAVQWLLAENALVGVQLFQKCSSSLYPVRFAQKAELFLPFHDPRLPRQCSEVERPLRCPGLTAASLAVTCR